MFKFNLFIITVYKLQYPGWFARDPSILYNVGQSLLQLKQATHKRARRFIFANDLFQFSKVPEQKTVNVVKKVIESLSGCKFHSSSLLVGLFVRNFVLSRF